MKRTKKTFLRATIVLVLCVFMSVNTTFAWLTDPVTEGDGIIEAGDTGLEMYWKKDLESDQWNNVETSAEPIFNYQYWEPGYAEVRYIKIKNTEEIPFEYQFKLISEKGAGKLADVIDVYLLDEVTESIDTRSDISKLQYMGTLSEVFNGPAMAEGILLKAGAVDDRYDSGEVTLAVVLKMRENVDNFYQNATVGEGFTVRAIATQCSVETE